jgi:hypothetical protein
VIEWFLGLPGAARVALGASVMAVLTWADLTWFVKTNPWRIDILIAAALGALAAWPFKWRARTTPERYLLMGAIAAFAIGMVWLRVTGRLASSFAFIFSVILLSAPVQRARGYLLDQPPKDGETPSGS